MKLLPRLLLLATPENHTDHYRWGYVLQHVGHAYQGRVGGGPSGYQLGWLALASASTRVPPLQDYIWFSGTSSHLGQGGTWTVYDAETASTNVAAWLSWSGDPAQMSVRMQREQGRYPSNQCWNAQRLDGGCSPGS